MSRIRVKIKFKGIKELRRNLNKLGNAAIERAEKMITIESARILIVAQERAPRGETGQLARNVQLLPARVLRGLFGATAIEGGFVFLEEYAHIQHERTDFRHDFGRSKYAESAINDEGQAFISAVATGVRNLIGR